MLLNLSSGELRPERNRDILDSGVRAGMTPSHAPAMLSVLECFREEDAETLGEILDVFQFDGEPMSGVYADCISRLQKAASLMERKEEQ